MQRTAGLAGGVALGICLRALPAAGLPLQQPVGAEFALAVDSGPNSSATVSRGRLALLPNGSTCLRVDQPLRQEIWLTKLGGTIFYPLSGVRMQLPAGAQALPPTFDALVTALADPAASLPKGAQLVSKVMEGEQLVSRWRANTVTGQSVGQVRFREGKTGVSEITLFDAKDRLQKRYRFGERPAGSSSMPVTIVAEHWTAKGELARRERWTLRKLALPLAIASGCAAPVAGQKIRDVQL